MEVLVDGEVELLEEEKWVSGGEQGLKERGRAREEAPRMRRKGSWAEKKGSWVWRKSL